MPEQVAKKKRVRKTSNAMLKITVERVETIWKKSRNWNRRYDEPPEDGRSMYEYVDAELPQMEKSTSFWSSPCRKRSSTWRKSSRLLTESNEGDYGKDS